MEPTVLCTLALPEPFGSLVRPHAGIRVLGRIPGPAQLAAELSATPSDVLCPQLADTVDSRLLTSAAPRLRAVCLFSVGYNNVDIEAATRNRVAVGNTPGVLTSATADFALGLIIAVARRLPEADASVRRGEFPLSSPDHMLGLDLDGALLGIVGFGRIGQAVARRALGFSMRVAYSARGSVVVDEDLRGRVSALPLDRLLVEADIVSLHVPLTDATRQLIDEGALRRMKPSAILVNTARGAVVDEPALVRALQNGWIAGAGLDVYEREPELAEGLRECPNAVLAPHMASATRRTRADMATLCAENTLDALAGRLPRRCVNPAAWAEGAPRALVAGA